MNKNLTKILIFIIMSILLFTGCDSNEKTVTALGPQNPTSKIEGFYEQHQTVKGGTGGSLLNLTDIQISKNETDETVIILSFAQGSQNADRSITPSRTVPNYETSFAKGVNRMIIAMEGVSYWSYKIYEQELQGSIINGIFAQRPVDSNISYLYINTNSDYAYKAEEHQNKIIITFHKVLMDTPEKSFYVTLNSYDEYEKGSFPKEFSMKPTVCANGENLILLSEPFESHQKAEEFIGKNNNIVDDVVPGKKMFIAELNNSTLPLYDQEAGLLELAESPIGFRDGNTLSFNPLIINGRILSFNNDYSQYVFVQPNTILGAQEGDSYSFEYLCKADINTGERQRLLDYQFTSLNSAKFSYDSKYVAFIDQNDLLRMLQILSLEDGKLYIPAEDSFGIDTASFVWAEDKNVLYAINGEFQSKQLLSYDLTDPDNVSVKGLFEQEFSESILQIKGNKIYYADRDSESLDSQICSVDINTEETVKLTDGYSFLLSPDGENLLINDMQIINEKESYRLKYIDIKSGDETLIQSGQLMSDVTWSTNGRRIYYSVFRNAGWDVTYPYALYYYDIIQKKSVYMMDMVTAALYPSITDEEVLLMCIFTYHNQPVPITYLVK